MKPKLTTLALFLGIFFCLGPWLLIDNPSKNWYWLSVIGGLLTTIAGYNSQARMLGLGEPGEELLKTWLSWICSHVKSGK